MFSLREITARLGFSKKPEEKPVFPMTTTSLFAGLTKTSVYASGDAVEKEKIRDLVIQVVGREYREIPHEEVRSGLERAYNHLLADEGKRGAVSPKTIEIMMRQIDQGLEAMGEDQLQAAAQSFLKHKATLEDHRMHNEMLAVMRNNFE